MIVFTMGVPLKALLLWQFGILGLAAATSSVDAFQDLISRFRPDEGLGHVIAQVNIVRRVGDDADDLVEHRLSRAWGGEHAR